MFIYIKDISIDGCEFLAPPSSVVVGVKTARTAILETLIMKKMKNQQKNQKPQVQMKRKRKRRWFREQSLNFK